MNKSEGLGRVGLWFAEDSFWNSPLEERVKVSPYSEQWCELLHESHAFRNYAGLHINLFAWTLPVYTVDASVPKQKLRPKLTYCPYSQGHVVAMGRNTEELSHMGLHHSVLDGVPIPEGAFTDKEADAHMVVVAPHENRIYDLWQCMRNTDGQWWSNSAIAYELEGSGVFDEEIITGIEDGQSVHFYGPCRASGVPACAGLIRRDEVMSGEIQHKLAFACEVAALQEFVFPATWTDGWLPGGLPEGCILQLDPTLDLDTLSLNTAGKVVAKALQKYGAVLVDNAGGATLYGEFLGDESMTATTKSWNGILAEESLFSIPFEKYRILETGETDKRGSHPIYHHEMSYKYYEYLRKNGLNKLPG